MPEDDPAGDEVPTGPLLPPDDRLWRHPSELPWPPAPVPVPGPVPARRSRTWALALASGVAGAAVTVAVIGMAGGLGGGVRERVVERVPVTDVGTFSADRAKAGVPAVAEAVSPSVVRVDADLPGGTVSGSGVVFRSDGTVLTNAHVVDGALRVTLVVGDGVAVPASVVGADRLTDVAVVAVDPAHRDAGDWVPAVLGSAADLHVGEDAIAVGSPLGLAGAPSVTVGVVSGLHRRVTADGVVLHDMIQTDAPIARGSSGGALCDATGVVVGITTALATTESGPDGLAFATPIDVARAVAVDLLGDGEVDRAWLGIEGVDARAHGGGPSGVEVADVVPGGPAVGVDLRPGDVVVAFDGAPVTSMSNLVVALRGRQPGESVVLDVARDDERHAVVVVLGERP